ncbi:ABC transporter permease [Comamonas sp. NLF-1-9]|uniref:ABC transporter permease n=1 Tax=Comamonas sp. NLF-1-9 TaxID=2853163 RepID=UPI001C455462|nr:ABC transporter permease [Comamonas sp. NLF-1-9]QXL83546.1 ABC transporter permease [Comamonas sp. NLF-1-9]
MHALLADANALWRARSLCWVLTRRDIAARYAGTALGVLWAYAQPLLTVAAYYLVFDVVFAMRLGAGAPTRAVGTYLIAGLLPWMAFADALSRGMTSLVESAGVLQKNALPPMLFVARAVLASSVVYAPLLVLLLLAYAPLHGFAPAMAALPLLVLGQVLLCLLWGAVLAILAAALRDVLQLVSFILSLGVFLSPVLFPMDMFPAAGRWLLWLNPMTGWVLGYQSTLLQGAWPAAGAWLAMGAWLLAGALVLELLLRRSREQLVDWL